MKRVFRSFSVKVPSLFLLLLVTMRIARIHVSIRITEKRQIEVDRLVNRNLAGDMAREIQPYLVDTREENSPVGAAIDANLREIIDEALGKLKPIERDVVARHH